MQCSCRKPVPMKDLISCVGGFMSFSVEIFLETYPEFGRLEPNIVQMQGDTSIAYLNYRAFGRMYALAVALLTAHRLATTYDILDELDANGKTNLVDTSVGTSNSASTSSLSEGSTPLGLVTGDDPFNADLARTGYGLQLLVLIKTWISPGEIVLGAQLGRYYGATQWPPPDSGY